MGNYGGQTFTEDGSDSEYGMAEYEMPECHELEHSIWDACLFVGLGVLGRFDTLVLTVSWVVNASVQFLFTIIIWSRFRESPFNKELVESLRKWRAIYGHDSSLMNPATQESLVATVCQGSDIMSNSQVQADLYQTMRNFLPRFVPDGLTGFIRDNLQMPAYHGDHADRDGGVAIHGFYFSGAELCTMLMVLWTLMICRELRGTYETHSAIWAKARDAPRRTELVRRGGHLVIRSITVTRATMMTLLVTIPRLMVACILLIAGSYFIVAAHNMEDLILNALSLEFIIHTDELLYSVIAPKNVRMIVDEVQPLRLGSFWNRYRTHFKLFMIAAIAVYVTMVNLFVLGPVITNMKSAMSTMCGGDINFVFKRYSDGVTRTVDPVVNEIENLEYSYGYCSVLQRTGLAGAQTVGWMGQESPLIPKEANFKCASITKPKLVEEATGTGELRRKGDMLLSENAIFKSGPCADYNLTANHKIRLLIQEATGNHFLKACADARAQCFNPPDAGFSSTLLRLYCPESCGCQGAGQFFSGSGEGCPRQCKIEWQQMLMTSGQCDDMSPEELSNNALWGSYVSSVVGYLAQLGTVDTVEMARRLNTTALTFGCRALTQAKKENGGHWDFCSPIQMRGGFAGAEHRTTRYFCPVTCGCALECGRDSSCEDCPRNCRVEAIADP